MGKFAYKYNELITIEHEILLKKFRHECSFSIGKFTKNTTELNKYKKMLHLCLLFKKKP